MDADDDLPHADSLDVDAHVPLLLAALEEDHARRDVTSLGLVPDGADAVGVVVAKSAGVLAGLPLVPPLFRALDPDVHVTALREDGEAVAEGTRVLAVEGRARAILGAERTALDVLGHLGGIASLTRRFVEAVVGTNARIYDTRKTLPGWRALEKYAVRAGGGHNHRMDLASAAMVKENHLLATFGRTGPSAVAEATRRLLRDLPPGVPLYVEVETLEEMSAAADAGAHVIMLDGFDLGDVREAVLTVRRRPPPRPDLEVTGGVRLENVAAFAATGVARISVGALTHSAGGLDLSMRFERRS